MGVVASWFLVGSFGARLGVGREGGEPHAGRRDPPGRTKGDLRRREQGVVGAIGVSGGSGEQEQEVAEAGAAAF